MEFQCALSDTERYWDHKVWIGDERLDREFDCDE